jgi:hypothetical protein
MAAAREIAAAATIIETGRTTGLMPNRLMPMRVAMSFAPYIVTLGMIKTMEKHILPPGV